ncbi:MAG: hypothetical protein QNJ46_09575 [Leptolyngbyaceae cyanobacterium MO_188.B28]|nr:hypothetical protein [Leptolyngbyaceae cyanobacterium MO_188.B28]
MVLNSSRRRAEPSRAVELIIKATDQASGKIQQTSSLLGRLGDTAKLAQQKMTDLGTAALRAIEAILSRFQDVYKAAQSFQDIWGNPVAQTALKDIQAIAHDANTELQSFTDNLAALGGAAQPAFAGFFDQQSLLEIRSTKFTRSITRNLAGALNKFDEFSRKTVDQFQKIPQQFSSIFGNISNVVAQGSGLNEPLKTFQVLKEQVGGVTSGLFRVTQEIGFFNSGLQALQQFVVGGPFKILIGQNVELREQLLATQSSLVATQDVFQGGGQILDPTRAIQALNIPISNAINQMRQESLDLVGVTSKELVPIYQLIAGLSSQIGANLGDAKDLTLDFAASLGTLGIPLHQAREEVSSLLQGTITVDSVLAKSLGITNEMVRNWQSQGKLIDKVRERLEAFRAGNALAAQTINGITSNIQEIFDEIARRAGEPLVEPIVERLSAFYEFLSQGQERLSGAFSEKILQIFTAVEEFIDAVIVAGKALAPLGQQLGRIFSNTIAGTISAIANGIQKTAQVLEPFIALFTEFLKLARGFFRPFLRLFILLKTLQVGIDQTRKVFSSLISAIPFAGELMLALNIRNLGLINSFTSLRKQVGLGSAAFLTLGQNLNRIPPLAALVRGELSKKIPIFGGAIAQFIPQASGFAVTILGLAKSSKQFRTALASLAQQAPRLIQPLAQLTDKYIPGLGGQINQAATSLVKYADVTKIADLANQQFATGMQLVGQIARTQLVHFTLLGAGLLIGAKAIEKFVLKNQTLKDALAGINEALDNFLTAVGEVLGRALKLLNNPIVQAILAIAALGAAIKLQLIPQLIQAGKLLVGQIVKGFIGLGRYAFEATQEIRNLSSIIRSFALTSLRGVFSSIGRGIKALILQFRAMQATVLKTAGSLKIIGVVGAKSLGLAAFAKLKSLLASLPALALAAAKGFLALAATLGPMLLLVAATTALMEAIASHRRINASTRAFKEFLTEAEKANIKVLQAQAANNKEIETDIDLREQRLEQIRREQGFFTRWLERRRVQFGLLTEAERQANKEYENYLALTSQNLDKQQEYRELIDRIREGYELSDEELEAYNEEIDVYIQQLENTAVASEEEAQAIANQIEKFKELKEAISEVTLAMREMPRLGTPFEQLEAQTRNARLEIAKMLADLETLRELGVSEEEIARIEELGPGRGDVQKLEQQAELVIKNTQRQLELNQISAEQARRNVENLIDSAFIKQELAVQAEQLLTKTFETEAERRVKLAQAEQQRIQALVEAGRLGQAEGERELTRLKAEELDARLKAIEEAAREEAEIRQAQLQVELDDIDKQIAETVERRKAASGDQAAAQQVAQQELNQLIAQQHEAAKALEENARKREEVNRRGRRPGRGLTASALEELNTLQDEAKALEKRKQDLALQINQKEAIAEQPAQRDETAIADANQEIEELYRERRDRLNANLLEEEREVEASNLRRLEVETQQIQNSAKGREQGYQEELKSFDEQQAILAGKRAEGLVSQKEYTDQSFEITMDRLDRELALIAEARSRLTSEDTDALEALAAQEAEIYQKRQKATQDFYEQQIKLVEQAQKKLLDQTKLAETERLIEIQKLVNAGVLLQEEAELEKLAATDERIKQELQLEQERLAELEKIPQYSDPELEAERQQEIRDARQRTTDLTLQLAESEFRKQELIRAQLKAQIEEQVRLVENQAMAQALSLKQQDLAVQALTAAFDRQVKILELRNQLLDASQGMLNAQLKVLNETTRNRREQRDIAQLTAIIQLRTLEQRLARELDIKKIQQEQARIALEREQAENRIAQIRNQAQVLQRAGEVRQLQEDPQATEGQIQAAQLMLQAALQEGQALQQQAAQLQRQSRDQARFNALELERLQTEQAAQLLNAELEFTQTLRGREKREAQEALRDRVHSDLGVRRRTRGGSRREFGEQVERQRERTVNELVRGGFERQAPVASTRGLLPQTPDIPLPPLPNLTGASTGQPLAIAGLTPNFDQQIMGQLGEIVKNLQSFNGIQLQQENQIINQFSPSDVENGNFRQRVEQAVLSVNYDVMRNLQQRSRK